MALLAIGSPAKAIEKRQTGDTTTHPGGFLSPSECSSATRRRRILPGGIDARLIAGSVD
jgi:hypothetical protein